MTVVLGSSSSTTPRSREQVLGPADAGYDEQRRIWNGSFDRQPAVIVRCAGVANVVTAVKTARASGLPVAVRSGGHSFPGLSVADDAFMIDLSPMKGVRVDLERQTARAQAGVLLGELDRETQAFRARGPVGDRHPHRRRRADARRRDRLDHADTGSPSTSSCRSTSSPRRASSCGRAPRTPDLFWGVRGGGGNFGIVTEFEFRCVPLGTQVLAGPIIWPMTKSGEVIRFYREWVAEAPDELMTIVIRRKAPPLPIIPAGCTASRS